MAVSTLTMRDSGAFFVSRAAVSGASLFFWDGSGWLERDRFRTLRRAFGGGVRHERVYTVDESFVGRRISGCSAGENCFDAGDICFQVVCTGQNSVDHRRGNRQLAVTHHIEQRFHFMGDLLHSRQFEEAGETFDRVKSAENRVYSLFVGGILFER